MKEIKGEEIEKVYVDTNDEDERILIIKMRTGEEIIVSPTSDYGLRHFLNFSKR